MTACSWLHFSGTEGVNTNTPTVMTHERSLPAQYSKHLTSRNFHWKVSTTLKQSPLAYTYTHTSVNAYPKSWLLPKLPDNGFNAVRKTESQGKLLIQG